MTAQFYVYAHKKPISGEIFYIGKGRGRRAYQTHSRNRWWNHIVSKHGFDVEILFDHLTEQDAFDLERSEIARIGRGNLCNNSDGGEGPAGAKHSEDACLKKSEIVKSKWAASPDRRSQVSAAFKGRWAIPEYRDMVIAAQKAAYNNPEVISAKKIAMRKSHATPVKCVDTEVVYSTIADAVDWLKSLGKQKAVSCTISYAASGKRPSAYGYRWKYL